MQKRVGCDSRESGEVFFFFRRVQARSVRTDFLYCSYCHPDSSGTVGPLSGEEEITQVEFFTLLDRGWDNPDI
jgi:hypothetical protein